jgi:hypothetical protein
MIGTANAQNCSNGVCSTGPVRSVVGWVVREQPVRTVVRNVVSRQPVRSCVRRATRVRPLQRLFGGFSRCR